VVEMGMNILAIPAADSLNAEVNAIVTARMG
jgi:hypothetical protein